MDDDYGDEFDESDSYGPDDSKRRIIRGGRASAADEESDQSYGLDEKKRRFGGKGKTLSGDDELDRMSRYSNETGVMRTEEARK